MTSAVSPAVPNTALPLVEYVNTQQVLAAIPSILIGIDMATRTDNALIYEGLFIFNALGVPSMKMHTLAHRRASHVAARIALVFYDLSSRVSQKQCDRLRGAHGFSGRALVRVL